MGLDAMIYCDCVEKNRLKVPHPFPGLLYIEKNGSPAIRSKDEAKQEMHDAWMELPPCKHNSMMVDGYGLGHAGLINHVNELLQSVLRPPLPSCPVLLERVLYDGTHTGDYLTISQVGKLWLELKKLKRLDLKNLGVSLRDSDLITLVVAELNQLAKAARRVNKPIAF